MKKVVSYIIYKLFAVDSVARMSVFSKLQSIYSYVPKVVQIGSVF